MEAPSWEGSDSADDYPDAPSRFMPKGKKSRRRTELKHTKEMLQAMLSSARLPLAAAGSTSTGLEAKLRAAPVSLTAPAAANVPSKGPHTSASRKKRKLGLSSSITAELEAAAGGMHGAAPSVYPDTTELPFISTDGKSVAVQVPPTSGSSPAVEADSKAGAQMPESGRQPPSCATENLQAVNSRKKSAKKHKRNQLLAVNTQHSCNEVQHRQLPILLEPSSTEFEGNSSPVSAADATEPRAIRKTKNKFKLFAQNTIPMAAAQQPSKIFSAQSAPSYPHSNNTARSMGQVTRPTAAPQQPSRQCAESSLLGKMRSKLQGGRFRWLNEQMYTQPGKQAYQLMHEDPSMFEEYHEGFQQQVRHWPQQPLDAAVGWVTRLPSSWVVADFGCGQAQLDSRVPHQVLSLDLVAAAPGVIACDMAHTPLETASVDAVVFCLALMGTDYGAFIAEALRVMKPKGRMWIAEVRSRFAATSRQEDYAPFCKALQQAGLKLTKTDASNKMFVVFEACKQPRDDRDAYAIAWPALKACQYKRR